MNQTVKNALNMALIILASLVMVGGLLICSTLKSHEQFMVGVVVVGVGAILVGLIRDFSQGSESR